MPFEQTVAAMRREAEKRNEAMEGGVLWRALDFLLYLVLIVLIMFSIRAVLIDPVRVDGRSMLDTLTDGEIMIVDRAAYTLQTPKRGDIVMCYYPDGYYESQQLAYASRVKRVIAVPIDEPYLTPERIGNQYIRRQTIPEGTVYLLGDNRSVSRDSRYDTVGPIPLYRVVGKVRVVLYPNPRLI